MAQSENPFKTYDIRGLYPDEIHEDLARRVGSAFVVWLRRQTGAQHPRVVVGRDMRVSSLSLQEAITEGIERVGGGVVDVGLVPTPLAAYATVTGPYEGGVMVSASHNPGHYNAFKLLFHDGRELWAEWGLPDIEKLAAQEHAQQDGPERREEDPLEQYLLNVAGTANATPPDISLIVDYGNGMGALTAQPLLERLGVAAEHRYAEPDGAFPNHAPNPIVAENITDLQQRVRDADNNTIGVAFDGDADRLRMIDETGSVIDPDRLACALALHRFERFSKDERRVFLDLRTSRAALAPLAAAGIDVVPMAVGRVRYKPALLEQGGILAGEFSGHLMFPEHFAIDDGLYGLVQVLSMMAESTMTLSDILQPFEEGWVRTQEINAERTRPFDDIVRDLRDRFNGGSEEAIDGLTLSWEDKWWNVRPSNTEPLVRYMAEARDETTLQEMVERIEEVLNKN